MHELEGDNKEWWHLVRSADVSQGQTQFNNAPCLRKRIKSKKWFMYSESRHVNSHSRILYQETITYLVITRQFCLDLSCPMYLTYSNALKMGSLSLFHITRIMRE